MNFSNTECGEQHIVTSNYYNPKVFTDFRVPSHTKHITISRFSAVLIVFPRAFLIVYIKG